jgi:rod shape-determining protein MreC
VLYLRRVVRNRIFTIVLTTLALLALVLLSSLPGSPFSHLTSPFSAVLEPVQKSVIGVVDGVNGFFESLTTGIRIRNDNKALLLENASLKNQITQLAEAGRQYQELKTALQLKDNYDRYEIIGGRVMTREIGSWFDVFRIDLGSRDGLVVSETESFAVVDAQSRLLGRVLSTDLVSAKVLPILHEGFAVSGKIDAVNGALLRVHGDLDLKSRGLCLIDQIPVSASLHVGDQIVTSGLGGLFPAGILIGEVVEIRDGASLMERQAVLKPSADLQSISVVFVMKGR